MSCIGPKSSVAGALGGVVRLVVIFFRKPRRKVLRLMFPDGAEIFYFFKFAQLFHNHSIVSIPQSPLIGYQISLVADKYFCYAV